MDIDCRRNSSSVLLVDALITIAVVFLAFAAFDDITTDNARTFPAEHGALFLCCAWVVALAARLVRDGYRGLGLTSFVVLAVAVWGQRAVGPGTIPSSDPHYLGVSAALGWFAVLAAILLVAGWRLHPERQAGG